MIYVHGKYNLIMCAVGVVCLHSYSLIREGRGGPKEKGRGEGMGRGGERERGEIGNSNGCSIQYSVLSITHG